MTSPRSDTVESVALPVANCVLCGWPMDGTVDDLEVRIGTALYRACADECPPAGVDRRQRHLAERRADADQVEREIGEVIDALRKAGSPWADLERLTDLLQRHSGLQGLPPDGASMWTLRRLRVSRLPRSSERVRERLRRGERQKVSALLRSCVQGYSLIGSTNMREICAENVEQAARIAHLIGDQKGAHLLGTTCGSTPRLTLISRMATSYPGRPRLPRARAVRVPEATSCPTAIRSRCASWPAAPHPPTATPGTGGVPAGSRRVGREAS